MLAATFAQETWGQTAIQIITTNCSYQVNANLTQPSCFGDGSGIVDLSFPGLTNVPEVEWIFEDGVLPANTDLSSTIQETLFGGAHKVRLTRNFCVDTIIIQLPEPDEITIDVAQEDEVCFGEGNGQAEVFAVGGVGQLKFSLNGNNFFEFSHFDQLPPDDYLMFVKDDNNCIRTKNFSINQAPDHQVEVNKQPVTCPGGNDGVFIVVIDSGALTEDFEFSLDGINYIPEPSFENLEAGDYTIHARSPLGCIKTKNFFIPEPPEPDVNVNKQDVTCPGGNDAVFIVVIDSGAGLTEEFEFSLDGQNYQQENEFGNLEAGQYTVFSKSPAGCVATKMVLVEEPAEPDMQVEKEDVTCPNGNDAIFIVVIDSGAFFAGDDYEYSLNGSVYQQDSIFKDLEAGDYTVYAKNQNGCVNTREMTISQPSAPVIQLELDEVKCKGGDDGILTINMTGATAPYTFSLDGLNFQTENIFLNLSAGVYDISIIDANGCAFNSVFEMLQPLQLLAGITSANATCGLTNGWIACTANGGTSPFNYLWNTGNTEAVLTDLYDGTFEVTVTDGNGCTTSDVVSIINEVAPLVSGTPQGVTCHNEKNGAISTKIEGFSPFTYEWSTGETTTAIDNLDGGTYTITITDKNNCLTSKEFIIEEPELLELNPKIANSGELGNIQLTAGGGTPPFAFEWNTGDTTKNLRGLEYGTYMVTVFDGNDCMSTLEIELDLPNKSIQLDDMVMMYPVPTFGELSLEFDLPATSDIQIDIYDEIGRKMYNLYLPQVKRETILMDLEFLQAAMYFVKIETGEATRVMRFIKQTD